MGLVLFCYLLAFGNAWQMSEMGVDVIFFIGVAAKSTASNQVLLVTYKTKCLCF
jgi:hypothetical protein